MGDLHEAFEKTGPNPVWKGEGKSENGLLCWGDPWSIDGFEVTEKHFRKWYRLHRGCKQLLSASNRWREMRGDIPLRWEEIEQQEEERLRP